MEFGPLIMMALRCPREAYRRVAYDAQVTGAAPERLVMMCLEEFVLSLGRAVVAHDRGDAANKGQALSKALTVLANLRRGISNDSPIAAALVQFYDAARRTLLDSLASFDREAVAAMRRDFLEIIAAMQPGAQLNS